MWEGAASAGALEGGLLIGFLLGIAVVAVYALRVGVPPMPSNRAARTAMLRMLPERVEGTVFDLGSAWGGLAFDLARKYPHNPVVGIELSPIPYLFARLRLVVSRRRNLTFRRADFLKIDLSDASALTCYLMIWAMRRLEPKLRAELKPGAVVVSHAFAFVDWRPDYELLVPEAGSAWIYRYRA
jgi:trans-aconitate methyltransferase